MKRFLSLILIFVLLLSGCSLYGERIKEPVTFYYVRSAYPYAAEESILGTEEREASGHRDDLSYLLALYLIGPSDEELVSPIPKGTRIYSAVQERDTVLLTLSDTDATLTDSRFSIACACLTMTCLGLTDAKNVTITSGERVVTMSTDTLMLYDISTETQPTEELPQ